MSATAPASEAAEEVAKPADAEAPAPPAGPRPSVELSAPLPPVIQVGQGSVLWLEGSLEPAGRRVRGVRVHAGEIAAEALAFKMPRPGTVHSGDWWWAALPVQRPEKQEEIEIEIETRVGLRRRRRATIGTVTVVPDPLRGRQTELALTNPPLGSMMGFQALKPQIAICLPTRNPGMGRFRKQIESMRAQTYENFRCVIADDGSGPKRLRQMREVLGDDERFELHEATESIGGYGTLELVLDLAPDVAPYIAIARQGDRWLPHRLELMLASFETSTLMVASGHTVLTPPEDPSKGEPSRADVSAAPDGADLESLLWGASFVDGSMMFRRELLTYALPFPPPSDGARAESWLPLVAESLGRIRLLPEPLYDRYERTAAQVAADAAGADAEEPRNWRSEYFDHLAWGAIAAEVLRVRCWDLMRQDARKDLVDLLAAVRHRRPGVGLIPILHRARRSKAPKGGEVGRSYLRGIAWRRMARVRARFRRRPAAA